MSGSLRVQILAPHLGRATIRPLIHREAADVKSKVAIRAALDFPELHIAPASIDPGLGQSPYPLRALVWRVYFAGLSLLTIVAMIFQPPSFWRR